MLGFFKKIFGAKKPKAASQPAAAAANIDFLSIDDDPSQMPVLASDKDVDVRLALAARLVDLLPGLSPERHSQLYAYAVQALTALAQDEMFKVRRALSTALRDYAKAPPAVVAKLARDVEREIAEPILRQCIALQDGDMLDILANHPEPWVISAIAGRPEVSEEVSDAVVETKDVPGTAVLLANTGARISLATLEKIVERAKLYPDWHNAIALRPELTLDLSRQLTGFVGQTVLDVLKERSDLDAPTRRGVADIVARRMAYMAEPNLAPEKKVELYAKRKALTPEVVQDALAWQEREFALLAIAKLSGVAPETVEKMMAAGAKPIVALCWKAKLPVRMCVEVQRYAGRLQPKDLLYPKGGTEYPLTPDEIAWQLEFFGVKK